MGSIVVLLVILGCAAYQYFKGTIAKGVVTIIVALCGAIVAFAFFEPLSGFFLDKGTNSRFPALVPYAQPLCFGLIFILAFGVLQTAAMQLMREPIDFGQMPERVGRVISGVLLGVVLSGLLLTVMGMAPLPKGFPYERFDDRNPKPDEPKKAVPNVDGLMTGWFSMISKGSFSGLSKPKSFAVLHPNYLDQLYLNRNGSSDSVSAVARKDCIEVLPKGGYWYAPDDLKDAEGQPLAAKSGHKLMVVRVGLRKSGLADAGSFTFSQLRFVCKPKGLSEAAAVGQGENVYPLGYLSGRSTIENKRLTEVIKVSSDDFKQGETKRWIDFVINVPSGSEPVMVQFKLNAVAELSSLAPADQIPAPAPFVQSAQQKKGANRSGQNETSGRRQGANRRGSGDQQGSGLSPVGQMLTGGALEGDQPLQ